MRVTHFQASIDREKLKKTESEEATYCCLSSDCEENGSYYQPIIDMLADVFFQQTQFAS